MTPFGVLCGPNVPTNLEGGAFKPEAELKPKIYVTVYAPKRGSVACWHGDLKGGFVFHRRYGIALSDKIDCFTDFPKWLQAGMREGRAK